MQLPNNATRSGRRDGPRPKPAMPAHIERNVEEISRLESRARIDMGLSDHFADLMTRFSGSMLFVWIHVAWFGVWIILNEAGIFNYDEFPFGFLTMIVSLEAIFLSTFVLISQNRQALQSDRRAKVDLEVNLIAEQEITKILALLAELHERMGLPGASDPDVQQMQRDTHIDELTDAVEDAGATDDALAPPSSAADMEH